MLLNLMQMVRLAGRSNATHTHDRGQWTTTFWFANSITVITAKYYFVPSITFSNR